MRAAFGLPRGPAASWLTALLLAPCVRAVSHAAPVAAAVSRTVTGLPPQTFNHTAGDAETRKVRAVAQKVREPAVGAAGRSLATTHEKEVEEKEKEIDSNPVIKTIAHSELLRNHLDKDHRPRWLQRFMWTSPYVDAEWVDSTLCNLLNWACPEPPPFLDSQFGHIYFWMLVFANVFVLLLLISVLGGAVSGWCDPMRRTLRSREAELAMQPLTVLLPCYLPNEAEIMDDTIWHIIHELEYGYPFTLLVCYNTPRPMAKETELALRDGTRYANGRRLQVMKVDGSVSKAENLNAALEHVATENVVIYDADHHPDPKSLLIATAAMHAHGVQCVQGSTYLRTRPNLLAQYINAEFFVTHFVWFPAMQCAAAGSSCSTHPPAPRATAHPPPPPSPVASFAPPAQHRR